MKGDLPQNSRVFKHFSAVEKLIRQCETVDAKTMGYGQCTLCHCTWYVAPSAGPDKATQAPLDPHMVPAAHELEPQCGRTLGLPSDLSVYGEGVAAPHIVCATCRAAVEQGGPPRDRKPRFRNHTTPSSKPFGRDRVSSFASHNMAETDKARGRGETPRINAKN